MKKLMQALITTLKKGENAVLCGIVDGSGSAPRTSGARMLVFEDQTFTGTIGGGALEGSCLTQAQNLLHSSETHRLLSFTLTAAQSAASGMICGGGVTVLLQRIAPADLAFFEQALGYPDPPILLTILRADTDPELALWTDQNGTDANLPEAILAQLDRKKGMRQPFRLEAEQVRVLAEPLSGPVTVYVAGAGHVGLATAHLAHFVGFDVVVLDDRSEFANAERFPQAREVRVVDNYTSCLTGLSPDDYVVIVTRGHLHDRDVLAQALRTRAGYIGMIGSRSKRDAIYASLREEGFTQEDINRVYSPIGLSIGADTPEEIGISIVGELIAIRAGRD